MPRKKNIVVWRRRSSLGQTPQPEKEGETMGAFFFLRSCFLLTDLEVASMGRRRRKKKRRRWRNVASLLRWRDRSERRRRLPLFFAWDGGGGRRSECNGLPFLLFFGVARAAMWMVKESFLLYVAHTLSVLREKKNLSHARARSDRS